MRDGVGRAVEEEEDYGGWGLQEKYSLWVAGRVGGLMVMDGG